MLEFREQFNLKNKSDKQISNYLLTFRKLKLIEKRKNAYIIHKHYLNFLSGNHGNREDSVSNNIEIFRDYIFIYSDLKFNFKYILYQLYRNSALRKDQLSKKMNINGFSINIFLEILQWLNLIKKSKCTSYLTTEAKSYLNEDKYTKWKIIYVN